MKTIESIISLAISEAIVQRREFTLLKYSDGTPTKFAQWMREA